MTEYFNSSEPDATIADDARFQTDNLNEEGRIQFFFHSPISKLPVRDVTNKQSEGYKTEPYIERYAENYCSTCYQDNNIEPFAKSREKYLFLITTCENSDLPQYDNRYIVGYIQKERVLDMGSHYAVQGPTALYRFRDAVPLSEFHDSPKQIRMLGLNKRQTQSILNHFETKENVYDKCLKRANELKELAGPEAVPPPEQNELSDNSDGC